MGETTVGISTFVAVSVRCALCTESVLPLHIVLVSASECGTETIAVMGVKLLLSWVLLLLAAVPELNVTHETCIHLSCMSTRTAVHDSRECVPPCGGCAGALGEQVRYECAILVCRIALWGNMAWFIADRDMVCCSVGYHRLQSHT